MLAGGYLAASAVAWADVTAVDARCVDDRPGQTPENFVASWRLGDGPTLDATPYRFGAEDVAFESLTPGLNLRAFWAPPAEDDGPVVIVVHGRGSCRRDAVSLLPAGMLVRNGFGVLVMDLRDHGDSDREDGQWAAGSTSGRTCWARGSGSGPGAMRQRPSASTVARWSRLVAFAMGNEPAVAAGFLDSPYADILSSSTAYAVANDRPAWIVPGALFVGGLISGDDLLGDSPARIFREELAGRPVFIVHGDSDDTISVDQGMVLAKAASEGGSPVEPWILPGVEHVQAAFVEPETYQRLLTDFFAGALGGGSGPPAARDPGEAVNGGARGRDPRCYHRRAMSDRQRFYLTTAIAYANNAPGLHTVYEVIGADVVARWHRMQGHDTRFLPAPTSTASTSRSRPRQRA